MLRILAKLVSEPCLLDPPVAKKVNLINIFCEFSAFTFSGDFSGSEAKALLIAEADFKSLAAGLFFLMTVTLSQSVLLCIMVTMESWVLQFWPMLLMKSTAKQQWESSVILEFSIMSLF